MKKNIKINTNREPLSKQDIERGKNFKTVYQEYYKIPKPLYKNKKFLGAVIILSIITLVLVLDVTENKTEEKATKSDTIQVNTSKIDTLKKNNEQDSTNKINTSTQEHIETK